MGLVATATARGIRLHATACNDAVKGIVDLRKLIVGLAAHGIDDRLSAESLNLIRLIGDLLLIDSGKPFTDKLRIRIGLLSDEVESGAILTSIFALLETGLTAAALQRIATASCGNDCILDLRSSPLSGSIYRNHLYNVLPCCTPLYAWLV